MFRTYTNIRVPFGWAAPEGTVSPWSSGYSLTDIYGIGLATGAVPKNLKYATDLTVTYWYVATVFVTNDDGSDYYEYDQMIGSDGIGPDTYTFYPNS